MALVRKSNGPVFIAILAAAIGFAVPVAAVPTQPGRTLAPPPPHSRAAGAQAGLSERDKDFLIQAADGGILQIELGQAAAARATNSRIRQYANLVSRSFGRTESRLDDIAEEFGIRLSHRPPADVAKLRQRLEAQSGPAVDREYVKQILPADAAAVNLFNNEAHNGQNPVMLQFAREMLPQLEMRQQTLLRLSRNLVG